MTVGQWDTSQHQTIGQAKSGTLRSYREDKVSVVIHRNTPDDLISEVTADNGRRCKRVRYQVEKVVRPAIPDVCLRKETKRHTEGNAPLSPRGNTVSGSESNLGYPLLSNPESWSYWRIWRQSSLNLTTSGLSSVLCVRPLHRSPAPGPPHLLLLDPCIPTIHIQSPRSVMLLNTTHPHHRSDKSELWLCHRFYGLHLHM